MEAKQFENIERLLRIIAHELYLARKDREFEAAPKNDVEDEDLANPRTWRREERGWLTNHIERLRETVDESTRDDMRFKD
ncbi:MAG: hypothetical protein ABSE75_13915 [Acidimicrobiales bacterium]|jgi:hypothetical protein